MDSFTLTKQGVRNLNGLGPKKKKVEAADVQNAEAATTASEPDEAGTSAADDASPTAGRAHGKA